MQYLKILKLKKLGNLILRKWKRKMMRISPKDKIVVTT
jgi:hypothetical protein